MRHYNNKRKFGRNRNQKKALLNSLALNLIVREKIKTTEAKAKELRPFIEKLITKAKKNDVSTRRYVPKYKDKKGGYTRILKLGARKSDGAKMAQIEFLEK